MGIFDWLNSLFADATTTFRTAVSFITGVVALVILVRVKFAAATTIITVIIAGFVIYCASLGGLEQIANLIGNQVQAQG